MRTKNVSVFQGDEWLVGCSLEAGADGTISFTNGRHSQLPANEQWLLPAFVDCQVYGADGALFSAYPSVESLSKLAAHNAKQGTAACVVTIATQPAETIEACIAAVKQYKQQGLRGIVGLHLEGPFINPEKRGAHHAAWMMEADVKKLKHWLQLAEGCITMMTLAPECCSDEVLKLLTDHKVIISAGHSSIMYAEAMQMQHRGVRTVTHVFNAMNGLHHREPGLALAALHNDGVFASIIPDGIHVHGQMLKLAADAKQDKLFFITDAVTATTTGPYLHELRTDRYCMPDGTLSGSCISMLQGVKFAVKKAGISPSRAVQMASTIPCKLLNIEGGSLINGMKQPAVLINTQFEIEALFNF